MLNDARSAFNQFMQNNPTFFSDMAIGTGPGGAMMGGVRKGVGQMQGLARKMSREGGMLPEGQGVGSTLFEMGGATSRATRETADNMTALTDAMNRAKMRVHSDLVNRGITPQQMQETNSKLYNELLSQNLLIEYQAANARSPEEARAIFEGSQHYMENIAPLLARMNRN